MARFWGKAGPPWIEKHGSASDTRRRGPGQDTDQRAVAELLSRSQVKRVPVPMKKTRQSKNLKLLIQSERRFGAAKRLS